MTDAAYWERRYRTQGPTYVARGGRKDAYEQQREQIAPLLERAAPRCGTLLDFGCGSGRFTKVLAARCERYIGVDLALGPIAAAPKPANADFWQISPGHLLPLDDRVVDVVACLTVLQHITNGAEYEHVLGELHRVLHPDGWLIAWDHKALARQWDDHMRPRGPEHIAAGLFAWEIMVDVSEDHWFGRAVKV